MVIRATFDLSQGVSVFDFWWKNKIFFNDVFILWWFDKYFSLLGSLSRYDDIAVGHFYK